MTPAVLIGSLLLAAILGLLIGPARRTARALAVGIAAFALAVAIAGVVRTTSPQSVRSGLPALAIDGFDVEFRLATSRSAAMIALVVALVVCAVQVYAAWYLDTDDRYPVFAATVSLFAAGMLLVVHAGDVILMLIGWEVMGWCSYLLIGHWSRRDAPRRAAHKALLLTRLADAGFIVGTAALAAGAGSATMSRVVDVWAGTGGCSAVGTCPVPGAGLRDLVMVLLLLGILGKSAQLPFQDWLPDAMEGPTPASALIHAATMVAAGTVVLAHLFPVLAAVLAFGQSDLKRLLAWSTVSQVAVMLAGLAVSSASAGPDAGLFHMWAHAIFKALLFLALGWLAALAGGTGAAALRGAFRDAPALLVWSTALGLVSLAGVPLFVGGLSKEHVLAAAYADAIGPDGGPGLLVLAALLVTVVLTAAYSTRFYVVLGAPVDDPGAHPAGEHSAPGLGVRTVVAGLGALTALGGLVLLSDAFELTEGSFVWSGLTLVLIAVGALGAVLTRGVGDPARNLLGERMRVFDVGFGADAAYRALATQVTRLGTVAARLDRDVIDGYVVGAAVAARVAGRAGERLHRAARPASGMALVVGGLLVLGAVGMFAWR